MGHAGTCRQIASQKELHAIRDNAGASDTGMAQLTAKLAERLAERLAAYEPPRVLLLVDMQDGFVTPAVPDPFDDDPPTTLRRLHAVAERCDAIAASGLFDKTICTAYRNTEGCPCRALLGWNGMETDAERSLYGSISEHADAVIWKDTYAARADDVLTAASRHAVARHDESGKLSARHRDDKANGIGHMFVAGIDTDACVLATCLSLFDAGVQPVLLADLCYSSGGMMAHESGLLALRRQIGDGNVISVDDMPER